MLVLSQGRGHYETEPTMSDTLEPERPDGVSENAEPFTGWVEPLSKNGYYHAYWPNGNYILSIIDPSEFGLPVPTKPFQVQGLHGYTESETRSCATMSDATCRKMHNGFFVRDACMSAVAEWDADDDGGRFL